MEDALSNRCGYTHPPDHEIDDIPSRQSCCFRETLADAERCVWHAHPNQTDLKTIEELKAARTPANLRSQTETIGELLDGAVLAGMDLKDSLCFNNTSLDRANLIGANLRGADLTAASLREADLAEAILHDSDLTEANLGSADLAEVRLSQADLTMSSLTHADLTEANLAYADLTEANLLGVDLTRANLQKVDFTKAYMADSNLTEANLWLSHLNGAIFLKATLQEAKLPGGHELRRADFTGADLRGHDFRGEDLSGASLEKADLTSCELSRANLSKANLERALLNRADLFDTRLRGACLEGAVLGNVQVNEGTFERLAPESIETVSHQSIVNRLRTLVKGPTGNDAYRCVYDPASGFELDGADGENSVASDSKTPTENAEEDSQQGGLVDDSEVRAGGVYRQFERLAGENALPEWQRRFFILRQDMQVRQSSGLEYAFTVVQRALFGYGESFGRVIGWSGAVIATFAAIYLTGGWIRPVESGGRLGRSVSWTQLPGDPSVLWESFYYSTLTFTALGFGDFRPVGTIGQLLTVMETASGALLLALLVFVLGRRAAR